MPALTNWPMLTTFIDIPQSWTMNPAPYCGVVLRKLYLTWLLVLLPPLLLLGVLAAVVRSKRH